LADDLVHSGGMTDGMARWAKRPRGCVALSALTVIATS